jgi:hypothetical protein
MLYLNSFTRQYPDPLPYGLLYRHSSLRTNRTSAYELCLKYDFNIGLGYGRVTCYPALDPTPTRAKALALGRG